MTYPWEEPPKHSLEDTVRAIQADMRFAVEHTCVLVRSSNPELRMVANTARGQDMPQGLCTYADGTSIEFQDIGMPQPNCPVMTMQELCRTIHDKALELGLELP